MNDIFTIFTIGMLAPGFGIMALTYSGYLYVRKRPSTQKMLFIDKEENVSRYAKREAFIFALWGMDIFALHLLLSFSTNQLLTVIGQVIIFSILIIGYYLRIKNDRKYLRK
ncbi:MAG: hypothetical protein ACK5KR_00415 [Breznakia sp.]